MLLSDLVFIVLGVFRIKIMSRRQTGGIVEVTNFEWWHMFITLRMSKDTSTMKAKESMTYTQNIE